MKTHNFLLANYTAEEIFSESIAPNIEGFTKESKAIVYYNNSLIVKGFKDDYIGADSLTLEIDINGNHSAFYYFVGDVKKQFTVDNSLYNYKTFNRDQSPHNKQILNAYNEYLYNRKKVKDFKNTTLEIDFTDTGAAIYDNSKHIAFIVRPHPINDHDYAELKAAHYEKFATFKVDTERKNSTPPSGKNPDPSGKIPDDGTIPSGKIHHILINQLDLQAWIDDPATKKRYGQNYGPNYETALKATEREIIKGFLND